MRKIKLLVMDVDGTLTDGKIYMGDNGEVFKAFNIHDGLGIHELLPLNGIESAILTGRSSVIVDNRAKELEVDYVLQGVSNKRDALRELLCKQKLTFDEVAYIGDDLADLDVMQQCALSGCPKDAVKEIREICSFVSQYSGGEGAVREFIEWMIEVNKNAI